MIQPIPTYPDARIELLYNLNLVVREIPLPGDLARIMGMEEKRYLALPGRRNIPFDEVIRSTELKFEREEGFKEDLYQYAPRSEYKVVLVKNVINVCNPLSSVSAEPNPNINSLEFRITFAKLEEILRLAKVRFEETLKPYFDVDPEGLYFRLVAEDKAFK